jgi:hypothetical protein
MTTRTRYFVIASLLVIGVGLGTGLVAYYVGFPAGAFQVRGGPQELGYIPRDATVIAYANVREVMTSELRQKIRSAVPIPENGQRELEEQTGINLETDIDRVVACLNPNRDTASSHGAGMVLARGRFDEARIESLMREHGAHVEDYKTKRLIVAEMVPEHPGMFSVAFVEPGLVALGSTSLVRTAIDLHQTGNNPQAGLESVTGNEELMNLVRSLESGNAWAVGRFDALTSQARLPGDLADRIPAITWFSVSAHVNGGIRGVIRAETRDDEAASNLRDVVRGFLALGKLQANANPQLRAMVQSLELGGTGKTVALSFDVPAEVFDIIRGLKQREELPKPPAR